MDNVLFGLRLISHSHQWCTSTYLVLVISRLPVKPPCCAVWIDDKMRHVKHRLLLIIDTLNEVTYGIRLSRKRYPIKRNEHGIALRTKA